MRDAQTWRELLGEIIKDPQERQRIADELNMNPVTLARWVSGDSKPRPNNLHLLLKVLPEYRTRLTELITEEFTEFPATSIVSSDIVEEISSAFYAHVFHANTEFPPSLHFWSICDLILQQALEQLDPQRVGIAIIVVKCMPLSSEHTIRSLREIAGRGSPPWSRDLGQQAVFLGAESMAGYAVTTGHSMTNQNLKEEQGLYPAHRAPWEESSTVHPILRAGRVAGCLLVSSIQPYYFPPARTSLIQNYADLLVIAFEPSDFYEMGAIKLGVMPLYSSQKPYLATFQDRVSQTMIEALRRQEHINRMDAELLVWQELENELLHLPSN